MPAIQRDRDCYLLGNPSAICGASIICKTLFHIDANSVAMGNPQTLVQEFRKRIGEGRFPGARNTGRCTFMLG